MRRFVVDKQKTPLETDDVAVHLRVFPATSVVLSSIGISGLVFQVAACRQLRHQEASDLQSISGAIAAAPASVATSGFAVARRMHGGGGVLRPATV
jgi:hypothetical protein